MNKERLLKLAEVVEGSQYKFNGITAMFDIGTWFESEKYFDHKSEFIRHVVRGRTDIPDPFACNTAACIAGFACLLFDYENAIQSRILQNSEIGTSYDTEKVAVELLGLSREQGSDLFEGFPDQGITGPEAAKVIRHFVETEIVDWLLLERYA